MQLTLMIRQRRLPEDVVNRFTELQTIVDSTKLLDSFVSDYKIHIFGVVITAIYPKSVSLGIESMFMGSAISFRICETGEYTWRNILSGCGLLGRRWCRF